MIDWLSERFAPGPVFAWVCLAFLILIPLVWLRASNRGKRQLTVRFSSLAPFRSIGATWASRTRFLLPLLRTATILCLLVAMARPQAGGEYRDTSEGIAIQMVLDVSGSMKEPDFTMDGQEARRVDVVKRVLEDFVLGRGSLRGRDNDLIGMTTFAMYADTPCPLTRDHASLVDLLRATDIPGWVDGRQVRQNIEANYTALGDAITLACDDLRRAGEQAIAGVPGAEAAKSRVMILLTDGANNPAPSLAQQSASPIDAARVASTIGMKIYTIGAIGTAQQQNGFGFFGQRRAQVDEPTLKEIATVTGAKYFRATDTDSLVSIYDEIDRLERHLTGERIYRDDVYAAKVAMLIGLALLMFELLLANTRYRRVP